MSTEVCHGTGSLTFALLYLICVTVVGTIVLSASESALLRSSDGAMLSNSDLKENTENEVVKGEGVPRL